MRTLLQEGQFATGSVNETKSSRSGNKNKTLGYFGFFTGTVSFSDQHGAIKRESITFAGRAQAALLRKWSDEGKEVGLLYLPDKPSIVIIDLFLK